VGGATITQVYAARAMAGPSPERLADFARDAEFVGKTMFTPASAVLVVFGFLLVNEGNWSLGSTWLIFALAVFAASFAVGIGFLAPESARIARAIELHGVGSTEATRRIEPCFRRMQAPWNATTPQRSRPAGRRSGTTSAFTKCPTRSPARTPRS
jgi:uncharacterized membrane protein